MTLSDHRPAPQDSLQPEFEDVDLPTQSRRDAPADPEDDENHLVRGYD